MPLTERAAALSVCVHGPVALAPSKHLGYPLRYSTVNLTCSGSLIRPLDETFS